MAAVGDAVSPADDLAFGRRRGRSRPRVVSYSIQCLATEVQAHERHVGAPDGVVEAPVDEGIERLFARVAARSVAAVMSQRDGLGEGHVEPDRARDAGSDLGHLEGVGYAPTPL